MASSEPATKRRSRRRRQADSGFFDSQCGGELPSPDAEKKAPLGTAPEEKVRDQFSFISIKILFNFKSLSIKKFGSGLLRSYFKFEGSFLFKSFECVPLIS